MTLRTSWRMPRRWLWMLLSIATVLSLATMTVSRTPASVRAAPAPTSARSAITQLCSKASEQFMRSVSPAVAKEDATVRQEIETFQRCLTAHDRSQSQQDAHWLALKNAHRIGRNGVVLASAPMLTSSASTLDSTVVAKSVEAWGRSNGSTPSNLRCTTSANETDGIRDDGNDCYKDQYYWNFCGAGAVENALEYWGQTIDNHGSGWYTEPSYVSRRTSSYWLTGGYNRAYEMYIAEYSMPPSFGTPGLVAFGSYPNAGASIGDVTDVLNWEASGKSSSGWKYYFYSTTYENNLTQSSLHQDIVNDITSPAVPVVVEVNTGNNRFSPYWVNTTVTHFITVIGYDDAAGTYTYTDTCGTACGSGQDGGVRTISQNNLWLSVQAVGSNGGISW